jgi:hypothetical protein
MAWCREAERGLVRRVSTRRDTPRRREVGRTITRNYLVILQSGEKRHPRSFCYGARGGVSSSRDGRKTDALMEGPIRLIHLVQISLQRLGHISSRVWSCVPASSDRASVAACVMKWGNDQRSGQQKPTLTQNAEVWIERRGRIAVRHISGWIPCGMLLIVEARTWCCITTCRR